MRTPDAHARIPAADPLREAWDRMRRADALVLPWFDPALRVGIDPEADEVVDPPAPVGGRRI